MKHRDWLFWRDHTLWRSWQPVVWHQWEPWDLQGGWFCSGLSPAWLHPGKYHKVPVPRSARRQVAYTPLGRFLVLFLTAQSPL